MQEQILQLSSTVKPGGATSPLPATPTRNRTKRQKGQFFLRPHIPLLISHYPYPQIPQSNFHSSWGVSPDFYNATFSVAPNDATAFARPSAAGSKSPASAAPTAPNATAAKIVPHSVLDFIPPRLSSPPSRLASDTWRRGLLCNSLPCPRLRAARIEALPPSCSIQARSSPSTFRS